MTNISNEIQQILSNIFMQIKEGNLESAWEVYDEFKKQLEQITVECTNENSYDINPPDMGMCWDDGNF